jgi:putative ABC transport system permease protein
MNIGITIREALISLTTNKMRTSLTVLGIVIGVAAVIAMLAVGRGAQNSITDTIQGIGSNLIFVMSGNRTQDVKNPKALTLGDATAMSAAVAPSISTNAEVTFGSETTNTSIEGVTPEYESVRNEAVTEGEFITQEYILGRAAVAVIGTDTADKLFGQKEGVTGQTIRISGQPFRIVGVLKSKGSSGFGGSQDDRVIIPLTTAQARLITRHQGDINAVDAIQLQATSPETVNDAVDQISQILRLRHRTKIGVDDFSVFTQEQILSTASSVTGVLTIFLGGIAAISLLVGGIGIMNIMLVSVTERTREIGLRKALGARKRDILLQFLTESILLSLIGGILGIILAWGIASLVGAIAAANNTAIKPYIGLDSVLLATLFSMAVGLLFGLYPANRAASLQPVEALRFE